jgi:hypothetical protein
VRERREIAAAHLLVQLGQLAADGGLPRTKPCGQIGERGGEARTRFEQHQCCRNARKLGDAGAPLPLLRRQEPFEEKAVRRQPCDRKRGKHGGRSRQCGHGMAGLARRSRQLEPRVGDERRTGV